MAGYGNIMFGGSLTFDHRSQEWSIFKSRFIQYCTANDINEENDKSGIKRRALLLTALVEDTYRVARDIIFPTPLESEEYKYLLEKLDTHFSSRKSTFAERYQFYKAEQRLGEDLAEWAARVRHLAQYCGFKTELETALRDRFVLGLENAREKEKLFAESIDTLTFNRALEIAQNVRCARIALQASQTEESADGAAGSRRPQLQEEPIYALRTARTEAAAAAELRRLHLTARHSVNQNVKSVVMLSSYVESVITKVIYNECVNLRLKIVNTWLWMITTTWLKISQSKQYGGHRRTDFSIGSKVLVKHVFKNGMKYIWKLGTVQRKIGSRMYVIFVHDLNCYVRKHVDQLLSYKGPISRQSSDEVSLNGEYSSTEGTNRNGNEETVPETVYQSVVPEEIITDPNICNPQSSKPSHITHPSQASHVESFIPEESSTKVANEGIMGTITSPLIDIDPGEGISGLSDSTTITKIAEDTRADDMRGVGVRAACSAACGVGQWARVGQGRARCCWACVTCAPLAVTAAPPAAGCRLCAPGHRPDLRRLRCLPSAVEWGTDGHWARIVAMAAGGVGLAAVVVSGATLWRHRATPVVKSASRELCALLLCSAAVCHSAALAAALRPATVPCALVRLAAPALAGVYAAILARTLRIARLVTAVEKRPTMRPRLLSSRAQVWTWLGLSAPGIATAAWSAVRWPPTTRLVHPGRARAVLTCGGELAAAQLPPLAPALVLLAACVAAAVRTRRLPHNFNETRFVGAAAYATCVTWVAFFPLYAATAARTSTLCGCVSLSAGACVALSLGPRVWVCVCRPARNTRAYFLTATSIRCHLGKYRPGKETRNPVEIHKTGCCEAASQTDTPVGVTCAEGGECETRGACARVTRLQAAGDGRDAGSDPDPDPDPDAADTVLIVLLHHRHMLPRLPSTYDML
ncbi:uncharacterized protein LOC131841334 [Achroia grisella]|uniref:uncharacterized protein LOC131841334 n=1 Tax=Achroia grisella TaxID=688607 RepID=UPI0027D3149D|nr:uncharacterized protein LOC131841334 [Achroia grisella]